MTTITISRQDGSLGNEIAETLAKKLGMQLILRSKVISEWMPEVADKHQVHMLSESPKFFLTEFNKQTTFKDYLEKRIIEEAEKVPSIIVGMGANIILANNSHTLKVRITASHSTRIERIKRKYGLGDEEAEKLLQKTDKKHKRYISLLYDEDWENPLDYDLTLNTDRLTIEQCVELISFQAHSKATFKAYEQEEVGAIEKDASANIVFKHPAEEEFAKILDMYGLDWDYEPRTFPVQWDAEGNVTMAFSPDFYLTKFDTYIEITTMDQKYVTTKNKKVKRLRELYPGININIVYKKDFHSLLKRFGFSGGEKIDEFNRS